MDSHQSSTLFWTDRVPARVQHYEVRCETDSYRVKIHKYWEQLRVLALLAGHTDAAAFSMLGHHFMMLTGKCSSDIGSSCFTEGISLRFLQSSRSKSKLLVPCISSHCWGASSLCGPLPFPLQQTQRRRCRNTTRCSKEPRIPVYLMKDSSCCEKWAWWTSPRSYKLLWLDF